jgi:hypothetical protein
MPATRGKHILKRTDGQTVLAIQRHGGAKPAFQTAAQFLPDVTFKTVDAPTTPPSLSMKDTLEAPVSPRSSR